MPDVEQNRTRQSAEMELLASMYPSEYKLLNTPSDNGVDARCSLQFRPSFTLELSLSEGYPDTVAPDAYLDCGGEVGTAARKEARAALTEIRDRIWNDGPGEECLDLLISHFSDWLRDSVDHSNPVEGTTVPGASLVDISGPAVRSSSDQDQAVTIKRTILWSHHLLATSKRKDIVTWSRELQLGGYSRPGYPGAIFIEGVADNVDEFVQRIKALRWQALQVRGETYADRRVCGDGVQGVMEVEGLGEVVEGLRAVDADMAGLFLECMKIGH